MGFRVAETGDAPAVAAIYHRYVTDTAASFEWVPPTATEMGRRIAEVSARYPFLICEAAGQVAGYAYASRHMERAGFDWNAVLSVYLTPAVQGRGVARALYGALEEILAAMGVCNLYGLVVSPNPASQKLHRAMGYTELGKLSQTGFKHGQWRDLLHYGKRIGGPGEPRPVCPVTELETQLVRDILDRAERRLEHDGGLLF